RQSLSFAARCPRFLIHVPMRDSSMRQSRRLFAVLGAAFAFALSSCTVPLAQPVWEDGENCPECKAKAKVCENPTMMALAQDLDHLEKHVEKYGSVVIKQPDVWGQARLTKYREEFEREMASDLKSFQVLLQGSTIRQDQAFFANATALSAAISGPGAVTTFPRGTLPTPTGTTLQPTTVVLSPPLTGPATVAGDQPKQGSTSTIPQDILNLQVFANPLRNTTTAPVFINTVAPTGTTPQQLQIGLEPTVVAEQKARFLNALNQIRRTNEGDDTADSP